MIMHKKPWPKDGLYIDELINTLIDFYEKPDDSLNSSSEWKENLKNKLLKLKEAAANANVTTVDDLTIYLHDRY
jgi:hypothetical protein|tara:strand:+ start:128 stop:349 length:222 start_codon:yes stop_codon:yes gene_type:complete